MAAVARRMGNAGNDFCLWLLRFCPRPAGGRAAVRYPSGANRRQCQTVPYAVGAGEYFPLHPVHYPAGLDDSVYPRDRRYLYRPAGSDCAINSWRRAVYRPHGGDALLEIPTGLIEASRAMGATPLQIVRKVLLPEALPGLVNAATITLITLVGYSAMGGAVGAGGLGQIGYQYGYIGYNATVMNTVLVLLVVLVYLIQFSGDRIVRAVTHK